MGSLLQYAFITISALILIQLGVTVTATSSCSTCTQTSPTLTIDTTSSGSAPFDSDVMGTDGNGRVTRTLTCTSTVAGYAAYISVSL
ncbi:unnamed protein product, partial [Mesorhabditis belari]|uniref:Antifreeze protein n=1 Tax=Mesorhabditis belari TaxID=2138241 RepID=A0AAF3J265_9BILA